MRQEKRQKKKVLYLITKSNWGGAQRYVYDLATNLDKNKFEVVVAFGGNGTLQEMLAHAGIRTISVANLERDIKWKHEWAFIQGLWQILKEEQPDILHTNSSKAGAIGTIVGRLRRVPRVIFTAHAWSFNEDRPWYQRFIFKIIHWITVISSHRTITVSRSLVEQMSWPFTKTKLKVINPGRSIGVMYNKADARAELIRLSGKTELPVKQAFWIGTIAELHPIKRLPVLIEAAATFLPHYPRMYITIIGSGEMYETLQAHINSLNLSDRIFLLGNVPEAARFLHAFDMFTLPSKSEAYGYVLHEAGLARLPVVATAVGGIRDIVHHNVTGLLVPPDNSAALAAALTKLYTDHTLAEKLRHELKQAMQVRTIDKMVTATTAIYTIT